MKVVGIDERHLTRERDGANFVVFIYEGGSAANSSWAVDSYLLTETDLPRALRWLRDNLPVNCCWSLGVVMSPVQPTSESHVEVDWVVGTDVLNRDPADRSPAEQRLADEMLARRHDVTLAELS